MAGVGSGGVNTNSPCMEAGLSQFLPPSDDPNWAPDDPAWLRTHPLGESALHSRGPRPGLSAPGHSLLGGRAALWGVLHLPPSHLTYPKTTLYLHLWWQSAGSDMSSEARPQLSLIPPPRPLSPLSSEAGTVITPSAQTRKLTLKGMKGLLLVSGSAKT